MGVLSGAVGENSPVVGSMGWRHNGLLVEACVILEGIDQTSGDEDSAEAAASSVAAAVVASVLWKRCGEPMLLRLVMQLEAAAAAPAGGELSGQLGQQLDTKTAEAIGASLDCFGRLLRLFLVDSPSESAFGAGRVLMGLGPAKAGWPPVQVESDKPMLVEAEEALTELSQPDAAGTVAPLRRLVAVTAAMLRHRIINIRPTALFSTDEFVGPHFEMPLSSLAAPGPSDRSGGRSAVATHREQAWLLERLVGQVGTAPATAWNICRLTVVTAVAHNRSQPSAHSAC